MIRGNHECKTIWSDPTLGEEVHGLQKVTGKCTQYAYCHCAKNDSVSHEIVGHLPSNNITDLQYIY